MRLTNGMILDGISPWRLGISWFEGADRRPAALGKRKHREIRWTFPTSWCCLGL